MNARKKESPARAKLRRKARAVRRFAERRICGMVFNSNETQRSFYGQVGERLAVSGTNGVITRSRGTYKSCTAQQR